MRTSISILALFASGFLAFAGEPVLSFSLTATNQNFSHQFATGLMLRAERDAVGWEVGVFERHSSDSLLYPQRNWHEAFPCQVSAWSHRTQTFPDERIIPVRGHRSSIRIRLIGATVSGESGSERFTGGKPVAIRFTAVDGREVDLSKLRGKVVLVDFWGTHCGPCVAELPRVKTAYEKFHNQGFEVIGISCDTEKKELEDYVQQHDIPWPQYFDGHQQHDNKFTVAFGIDGIPHMFILDKNGCLRFDNVRAKGAKTDFEDKIESLLD